MHTEVEWTIEFDKEKQASHTINIRLINLYDRIPSVRDYIRIRFSDQQPLEQFHTKVEDVVLEEGYGFSQETTTYALKLDDIPVFAKKPLTTPTFNVAVTFKQRGIIRKVMDMNLIDLPLTTDLGSSSTRLVFRLPPVSSRFSRLRYWTSVLIKRNRDVYDIQLYYGSSLDFDSDRVDKRKGEVAFDAKPGDIKAPIQFVYKVKGKLDFPSVVLGAVFTIIIGVIVTLIVDFVHNHLPKLWNVLTKIVNMALL